LVPLAGAGLKLQKEPGMENQLSQGMAGIQKLKRPPIEVDFFLDYKLDESKKDGDPDRYKPDPASKVKVWMHPLTRDEWTDVEAVYVENYRAFKAKGGEETECRWKANRVQDCLHLFYSLKVGPEPSGPGTKGSERLFKEDVETLIQPYPEVSRMIEIYNEAFVPTREERKNCLRERLGLNSGTPSISPSTSTAQN
jgi:hypothetical protein